MQGLTFAKVRGLSRSGMKSDYFADSPSPHACILHPGKPEVLGSFTVCGSSKCQRGI